MGSSLFDRLGPRLHFAPFQCSGADTSALEQAAAARGIPLTILDVKVPQARALYGRDLALVRPDQYIAWRGDRLPNDLDALLARVTGH